MNGEKTWWWEERVKENLLIYCAKSTIFCVSLLRRFEHFSCGLSPLRPEFLEKVFLSMLIDFLPFCAHSGPDPCCIYISSPDILRAMVSLAA